MKKIFLGVLMLMLLTALCAVGASAAAPTVWDGTAATAFAGGTGTESDPYQIATAEQLAYLRKTVNDGTSYTGQYFKLTADIVLNDTTSATWTQTARSWTPIGTYSSSTSNKPFSGNFDGNGHMIIGIYINKSSTDYQGLFGYTYNANFNDLTLVDMYLSGQNYVGALVGKAEYYTMNTNALYEIKRCTVNVAEIKGNSSYTGGLVGYTYSYAKGYDTPPTLTILYNGCAIRNSTVSSNRYVGGIMGYEEHETLNGTVTVYFANCTNSGKVSSFYYAGGIAGNSGSATFSNCTNSGEVSSSRYASGIAGDGGSATFSNCTNVGTVSAIISYESTTSSSYYSYAGGIAGDGGSATFLNCTNTGTVSATITFTAFSSRYYSYAGGIAGDGGSATFSKCTNSGMVSATSNQFTSSSSYYFYTGGIAGGDGTMFTYCSNTGEVFPSSSGSSYAGGIVGYCYSSSPTIRNCYNTVTFKGNGIVAYIRNGEIDCCYNIGTVSGKVIAYTVYNTVITNCYYLSGSGTADANATALTDAQMCQQASFVGFDFNTIWIMGSGDYPYPILSPQEIPTASVTGLVTNSGDGLTVIELLQADEIAYSTTVTGNIAVFTLTGVTPGTYDLRISKPFHLDYTLKGITVADTNIDLTQHADPNISAITLVCGDLNGDGTINILDVAIIRGDGYGHGADDCTFSFGG